MPNFSSVKGRDQAKIRLEFLSFSSLGESVWSWRKSPDESQGEFLRRETSHPLIERVPFVFYSE